MTCFFTTYSFDLRVNSLIFSPLTIALFDLGPTSLIHTLYSEPTLRGSHPEVGARLGFCDDIQGPSWQQGEQSPLLP